MPNSLHNLIANGGCVVIAGGHQKSWSQFRQHPQLVFWSGDRHEVMTFIKKRNGHILPDNTHAVILSRFLSHSPAGVLIREARKRNATIFGAKNDGEITKLLTEITAMDEPITLVEKIEKEHPMAEARGWIRGEQKEFIAKHHQPELKPAEEGRRLHKLATEMGYQTTTNSMIQAVRQYRGITVKPKTKQTTVSKSEDNLLTMIDDAIAAMTVIREELVNRADKHKEFKELKSKFAAFFE